MKKKLSLDKELISAVSDPTTLDGGYTTYTLNFSCHPDLCPSCTSCPPCAPDEEM